MYRCRDLGQAENLAAVLVNYKDSWINDFDLKKNKKKNSWNGSVGICQSV